jgi:hypothetical protein
MAERRNISELVGEKPNDPVLVSSVVRHFACLPPPEPRHAHTKSAALAATRPLSDSLYIYARAASSPVAAIAATFSLTRSLAAAPLATRPHFVLSRCAIESTTSS